MRVDAATLGLVFSAVSTLVVIVGALAAVRQLQHLRRGNELAAITKFVEEWSDPSFTADRHFVRNELAALSRQLELHDRTHASPKRESVFRVAHFFERMAYFVHTGALSEEMAMFLFGEAARLYWNAMRDFIAAVREQAGTQAPMEFFEDFAVRAPEWAARNERRSKGLRRDPALTALVARDDALPAPAANEGQPIPET